MKNPITLKRKRKVISKGIFELAATTAGNTVINYQTNTSRVFFMNTWEKRKPQIKTYAANQRAMASFIPFVSGVISVNGKACGYVSQQHGLVVV